MPDLKVSGHVVKCIHLENNERQKRNKRTHKPICLVLTFSPSCLHNSPVFRGSYFLRDRHFDNAPNASSVRELLLAGTFPSYFSILISFFLHSAGTQKYCRLSWPSRETINREERDWQRPCPAFTSFPVTQSSSQGWRAKWWKTRTDVIEVLPKSKRWISNWHCPCNAAEALLRKRQPQARLWKYAFLPSCLVGIREWIAP